MRSWLRSLMAVLRVRRSLLGIDPVQRAWARERVAKLDQRLAAILTAAQANKAQQIVQETGRRRG